MFDSIFKDFWLIGFVVGSMIRGIYNRRERKITSAHQSGFDIALLTLASIGLFFLPIIYLFSSLLNFADYYLPLWTGWLGMLVFIAALCLLWRSHVSLGSNFSLVLEIKEKHSLITHGVFRYIRHPIYAAHLLWGIAQALLLHNWIAGYSMLFFFLLLYWRRVSREERMMLEYFGDEYSKYMKRTGRLIPKFWK